MSRSIDIKVANARWVAAAAVLATCLACHGPLHPQRSMWAAMLYGTVSDSTGAGREHVVIDYELYQTDCSPGSRLISRGNVAITDNIGNFRGQINVFDSSYICLRVLMRQADGSRNVGAELPSLPLKPVGEASLPYDSVRVDLKVP